jgi:hypothetical protein
MKDRINRSTLLISENRHFASDVSHEHQLVAGPGLSCWFQELRSNNVGLEAVQESQHFAAFSRTNTKLASNVGHDLDETRPVLPSDPHALVTRCHIATGVVHLSASLFDKIVDQKLALAWAFARTWWDGP